MFTDFYVVFLTQDRDSWRKLVVRRTYVRTHARTHTHTHTFNGLLSGTTRVSRYQKGETNLDFTEARDNKWQWHRLGNMQVCRFLQAGCPSCCPTNSVKALQANGTINATLILTLPLVEYSDEPVCLCLSTNISPVHNYIFHLYLIFGVLYPRPWLGPTWVAL